MKGQKTGGRQKGTPNFRSTRAVQATLDERKCDPIDVMAELAMDKDSPRELRGRMAAELANYLHPKRKAIEHTGPGGGAIELNANPRELLARKIAELRPAVRPDHSESERTGS
jgi:hypothetical protein